MEYPKTLMLAAPLALLMTVTPAHADKAVLAPVAAPAVAAAPAPTPEAVPETHDIRVQVVAESSAVIGAPMAGLLKEFPFKDGDRFDSGAVLASFVCDEQQAALAHARAVLSGKKAMLSSSQKLKELGTGSALDYDVSAAGVAEAQADLDMTSARVKQCSVTAPFAGRVATAVVHNHQFVQEGAPLLDVVGDAALEAQMIVPSRWLTFVKPGLSFPIEVDETGKKYQAEITRISGRVDAVSQSIKIYAKFDDATPDLLAGMSGRALLNPPAGGN